MLNFIFERSIPCDIFFTLLFFIPFDMFHVLRTESVWTQLIAHPFHRTSCTGINLSQNFCLHRTTKRTKRLENMCRYMYRAYFIYMHGFNVSMLLRKTLQSNNCSLFYVYVIKNSSVGIANIYGLDGPGIEFR